MTDATGEAAARAALAESVEKNRTEVQLADETIQLLREGMRDDVRSAVREGMAEALSDENAERIFAKFFEVLQRQATERTGRFVLGGIGKLLKRMFWVGLLVAAIYAVGGWSLLKTVWAAVRG